MAAVGEMLSPLIQAVWDGDSTAVRQLLEAGADPDRPGPSGVTPLAVAVLRSQAEIARLLARHGATVDRPDDRGVTPLMYSAELPSPGSLEWLLAEGADPRRSDSFGQTVLSYAVRRGRSDAVARLLDHGADVSKPDAGGVTALMLAATRGHGRVAALLLRKGADPDAVTPSGHTALMLACIYGRPGMVRALLVAGADPRLRTMGGRTAAEYAVAYAQRHALRVLLEVGPGGSSLVSAGLGRRAREVLRPVSRRGRPQAGRFSIGGWAIHRAFAAARQRTTKGVSVGVLLPDGGDGDALHALVASALELLAERDPKRLARLREGVRGILVFPWAGGAAGYHPDAGICLLTPKELTAEGRSQSTLAATLTHEATHARLFKLGFGYSRGAERIRIERACYRAELALAERLDERGKLEEAIEDAMLALPEFYSRRRGILAWLLETAPRAMAESHG